MLLAIQYPSWITPEIFPNVPFLGLLRWYGLMYLFAFGTAYLVFKKIANEGALNTSAYTVNDDDIVSFFSTTILFLLLGARIFSTLIYDTSDLYWKKPWLIFWPFSETGQFTGLAGMSYHGGYIGGFTGMAIWCIRRKKSLFQWMDVMAVSIPLGYTFGRLGNFLNGELYGRITTKPWGIIFPNAHPFSTALPWVQDFAAKAKLAIPQGAHLINLPRHPSQLYEAFLEGIVLFVILWFLRKRKPFHGFLTGMYSIGYGVFRFIIEYYRQPDEDLGYRIAAVKDAPTYLNASLLNISTGQILCILMIAAGITLIVIQAIRSKNSKNFKTPASNSPKSRKKK